MADVKRRRFILGLRLCAAGIAMYLASPWVPIATGVGLLLFAAGAAAAATAPIPPDSARWLWACAGLASGSLLLYVVQHLVGFEFTPWVVLAVLHRTAPPTYWFAAGGCLCYAMILTGEASGARFSVRNALAFFLMFIFATLLHAFTSFRGGAASRELFPTLEMFRFAAYALGIIQIVFLLLLVRAVRQTF